MKTRLLGNTDLSVSQICLGCSRYGYQVRQEDAFRLLDAYCDMGGNFLDTANVYCRWVEGLTNCSEQVIGAWLRSRRPRNIVVATKGGHYGFAAPHVSRITARDIVSDLEDSLRTLGMDCIDFYWLHRDDPSVPIEDILRIMEDLVKAGKIRWYGASNYSLPRMIRAEEMKKANRIQGFSAVSNQWSLAVESSRYRMGKDPTLVRTGREFAAWHERTQVPLIPFTSGAQGYFSHASADSEWDCEANRAIFAVLERIAAVTGESPYVIGQAWLMTRPFQTIPIMRVSGLKHMADLERICTLSLDGFEDELKQIETLRGAAENE